VAGKFFTLEGLDGCGKSTQVKLLARWLRRKGYGVLCTDEPTDGPVGRAIKKILAGEFKVPAEVEVSLFAADRMWHVSNLIRPSLEAGKIVLNERYVYSSLAYQSARGASAELVRKVNELAPPPDLAILIDVPAEVALSRIKKTRSLDEFEKDLKLQKRVRMNYLKLSRKGELQLVDGMRSVREVQSDIRKLVNSVLTC
jgi:dTMP kinase